MDSDWGEVQRLQLPPPEGNGLHHGSIGTIAFDTHQELLWVGNECGRITSFYGTELTKYISIRAHPATEGAVVQFLFHERGVISLSSNSVHLCSRRGLTQWHLSEASMTRLSCMSYLGKDSPEILVAGYQNIMYKIDVEKGQIIQEIPTSHEYVMMKYCRYVCAGTVTGRVNVLDPETLTIVKSWQAHPSSIHDMDAQNNYLVTCGWSIRPYGPPMLDILAQVFDLRKLEQLRPIPFPGGAAFVQMHPKMSTTGVVASQTGQLQVVDLMNPDTSNIHQAGLSTYMLNLAVAPSGAAWALTDQENAVHIWGSSKQLLFAEFADPPEFADDPAPLPLIPLMANVPLSTVGMPHYREKLLSAWPSDDIYEVGHLPSKIDAKVLKNMHPLAIGYRAANPRKGRRNEVSRTRSVNSSGTAIAPPQFLSQKARESEHDQKRGRRMSDAVEALANMALAGSTKPEVPIVYRNVEIKYSKFGVDDFDFKFYNKTQYSGLETHITNSYLNPLLQLFKFTPLIRNLALHHAASNCTSEGCLLCEMGFLFDMLEKADGLSCQATNFLKAFSNIPEAVRLGVLEESSSQSNSLQNTLEVKIQLVNRFLLEQIAFDSRRVFSNDMQVEQILRTTAQSNISCNTCQSETVRPGHSYLQDLNYVVPVAESRLRHQVPSFSSIVKSSLERSAQTRAWCDKCRRYRQLTTRTQVKGLPPVLIFNAGLEKSTDGKQLWSIPGWLPEEIGVSAEGGHVSCHEGDYLRVRNATMAPFQQPLPVYELVGMVADINSGEHQKPHLVSIVNVAISESNPTEQNKWHLLNDFLVREIPTAEALHFAPSWKMPVILLYQLKTLRHAIDDSWKDCLDTHCLYYERSPSLNSSQPIHNPILPLDFTTEAPHQGSLVAIDTEFVALRAEEIEISATGAREVIRPTRLGLARVSVLRGDGPHQDIPFINDHIIIREPIVDYLTKYSGLKPGDLDSNRSTHALVTLKVAYKKLWLLLNLGVVFVGHGLPKDFRTINIHVPKAQVLDTVDLFYIRARQRKLSLRFLAWYLLKEDIQQETHDSVEDARTALRLWRKFEEFQDAGIVDQKLEEIYREGRKWAYKPPSEQGSTASSNGNGGNPGAKGSAVGNGGGPVTPPIIAVSGISGPGTPVGRRAGGGRESEYFESPLR